MKRRLLLSTVPAALMAACTPTSTTPTVSQLASDASLIASGMAAVVTALQSQPGIPAATLVQLQGYLATLQKDAAAVAAATATPATSTVQEIAQIVQTVAPIALSFVPGGGAVAAIVQAAVALLPAITAAIGVAGAPLGAAPVYAPDQARLILRAAPALAAPK